MVGNDSSSQFEQSIPRNIEDESSFLRVYVTECKRGEIFTSFPFMVMFVINFTLSSSFYIRAEILSLLFRFIDEKSYDNFACRVNWIMNESLHATTFFMEVMI